VLTAIVLAAGASTRMGAQKVLLPYRGQTVLGAILSQVPRDVVGEIIVVTGHERRAVEEHLERLQLPGVVAVHNELHAQGMLSSVRAGLRAVRPESPGYLLLLGDHPHVTRAIIEQLHAAWRAAGMTIAVPVFQGRRGHPLIFHRRYRDDILHHFDDCGLRGLLQRASGAVCEWPAPDASVLEDMDTPEDYRRAIAGDAP